VRGAAEGCGGAEISTHGNHDESYEEFTTVQPYIANPKQMASFKNMGFGEM
jgi:hypothetical protein